MLNLLIPGPEAPLVEGIVDKFQELSPHIKVFGPSQQAARMEGSKTFSKDFMARHNIPTARYQNFSDHEKARSYLENVDYDVVIKASGLAAGKGVIIPQSKQEGLQALKDIMSSKQFGSAGDEVVIEEFLQGDEVSILTLTDGTNIKSLPPAQDHKRIGDGDTGGNTGGMGTYAPAPVVSEALMQEIERTILIPTALAMKAEGYPMVGCLFTGFMIAKDGTPRVLEYNVRFGDPETQSCLPLLESDLAELMLACCDGTLASQPMQIYKDRHAATVVVAAAGYPDAYEKGTLMTLKPVEEDTCLFHAGTTLREDADGKVPPQLVTSGGRVIAATATGGTLREAVDRAYKGVESIQFEGMQYRKDIAARAL